LLRAGVGVVAAGATFPWLATGGPAAAEGSASEPFPLPWLDQNLSHNQTPGPGQEPASFYHFQGQVARANKFTGGGTDGQGNRIAFGGATSDFSFMRGEFVYPDGQRRFGTFAHI